VSEAKSALACQGTFWPWTGPQVNFLRAYISVLTKGYIAEGKKKTMRLDVGVIPIAHRLL